jgi:hypothetical protein
VLECPYSGFFVSPLSHILILIAIPMLYRIVKQNVFSRSACLGGWRWQLDFPSGWRVAVG